MSRRSASPRLREIEREEQEIEYESLTERANHIEQEARMILPGVQALFGFQLVAAFETEFWTRFSHFEHLLHWFALAMGATAAMLVLIPAAYHRQVEANRVSQRFLTVANRSLYWGLYPLMLAISVDFYLIGRAITRSPWISLGVTLVLLGLFLNAWFIYPYITQRRHERERARSSASSASSH